MAWLTGWQYRVKITIDAGDIDADLANFPILIYISESSGINAEDVSLIFDRLGSYDNRKKIAFTTSDGTTQCYAEIENWDQTNKKAWIWVKVPTIDDTDNTELYMYYDPNQPDNTTYIGDCADGSNATKSVWDDNFFGVWHLNEDPTTTIKDSTQNNITMTGYNLESGDLVNAKIGKGLELDGVNERIRSTSAAAFNSANKYTLELWVYPHPLSDSPYSLGPTEGSRTGSDESRHDEGGVYDQKWSVENYAGSWVGGTASILNNNWSHIVSMHDGANNIWKTYVNGAIDINSAYATDLGTGNLFLKIGALMNNGGCFDGVIDEIRFSKIERSAAWLRATYETGRDHLLDWGSEETSVVLKEVADSLGLSDVLLCDKAFVVVDSVGLVDVSLRDWTPQGRDAIVLSDTVLGDKEFSILDLVGVSELVTVVTEMVKQVTDGITFSDVVGLGKTLLLADQIQLAEDVYVSKILAVSDDIALVEVVEKAVAGAVKTRIFLLMGDVAIQLTGD